MGEGRIGESARLESPRAEPCGSMWALDRGGRSPAEVDVIQQWLERLGRGPAIRCPHCAWRPTPANQWLCQACGPPENLAHGCGAAWNTFATGGRCPGCQHQWRWTACLACSQWSPHEDWYDSGRADQ